VQRVPDETNQMSMLTRRIFGVLLFLLLAVAGTRATLARTQAPTQDELRVLVERIVANQHRNDAALAEYERRERVVARKSGEEERIVEDKTYRVFPTGTGTIRVLLEEKGRPVKREAYEKGLRYVEEALVNALNPDLSRQKEAVAKWEKRTRERTEMVDAVPQAFLITWLGRETRNGRTLAKLKFEPNPEYKPASRNTELFTHVSAVLWVDEKEAQVARMQAEISRDIGVFGGVFGKVYKGGTFVLEQAQVADGVWLPTRYEFDYGGRRFVFPFAVNETTEAAAYRRIGSPKEALAAVRRELQSGGSTGPVKSGTANGSR
jgi:hypothetical protein